jgi:hypothetical protein
MSRITSLLLLGGLLAAPVAAGAAQDRARPSQRETPRREAPPPERPRAEPPREEARPRPQERVEPRREAPVERREVAPPRSTGEPELRRRKAEKPD